MVNSLKIMVYNSVSQTCISSTLRLIDAKMKRVESLDQLRS